MSHKFIDNVCRLTKLVNTRVEDLLGTLKLGQIFCAPWYRVSIIRTEARLFAHARAGIS
jgi:hypothetical protein